LIENTRENHNFFKRIFRKILDFFIVLLKNIILYNIKYSFGINESTSFTYSESSSSGTSPRKIRSLDDSYEVTNPFDDDGIRTTLLLLRQDIVKRNKR